MSERFTRTAVLGLLLLLLTAACYAPAAGFQFLNYDDDQLVTDNAPIARGLNSDTLRWSFTTTYFKTWQPLVWLSYLTDATFFGISARAFHLTNVALHILNVLLVFAILTTATGRPRASALAAAIFALHPLQVEPVAWVAERKGLLSATFILLALLCHVRESSSLATLLFMSLALMAKGTAVVTPLLMLALDIWPLRRHEHTPLRQLVLEKKLLFALALASGLWTSYVFGHGGALPGLDRVSTTQRISNTLLSPFVYAGKFAFPTDLAIPYRHAPPFTPRILIVAIAALVAGSTFAYRTRYSSPHLIACLLFSVSALLPVIGLIPVGHHWIADRYMYLPLIGVSALIVFSAADLARTLARPAQNGLALVLLALIALSHRAQLVHWHSSATLFAHTLDVDPDNVTAHSHLAKALASDNQLDAAMKHYWRAIELEPATPRLHYELGVVLMMAGRHADAAHVFHETRKLTPNEASVAYNLGYCLAAAGKTDEAIAAYEEAAALDPTDANIHANLGAAYQSAGKLDHARAAYRKALEHAPGHPVARKNLSALEPARR